MTGNELLRRVTRLGRSRGVAVYLDKAHGKGSHGTLYYGARRTTLKDPRAELGRGLLRHMLSDLGLTPRDLNE
jgi:mRNA interferase HicA